MALTNEDVRKLREALMNLPPSTPERDARLKALASMPADKRQELREQQNLKDDRMAKRRKTMAPALQNKV